MSKILVREPHFQQLFHPGTSQGFYACHTGPWTLMRTSEWILGISDISMCKSSPSTSDMNSFGAGIIGGRFWIPRTDVETPGDLHNLQQHSCLETSHLQTFLLINPPCLKAVIGNCLLQEASPDSLISNSSHLAQTPILQYLITIISLPLSVPPLNC